jgi:hypothetical protein
VDEPLAGLLLLVPGTDRDKPPMVDGTPIPVVTAGQWTRVPSAWLDRGADDGVSRATGASSTSEAGVDASDSGEEKRPPKGPSG